MGLFDGFFVTMRQMWRPRVTVQYPEVKRPKPPRFHGRHVLNRYEDGMEKCIGCELCAGVCPARCIYVRGADNPEDAPVAPGERYGFVYEINYLRCIHCDLCVEACPTEAITESKMFEFSFTNRADAIYTKEELLIGAIGVVVSRHPVHSALMLIQTLFGVAVLFVAQQADFLAAVQVIVYAGAIVVLFLFVIMLVGVDREESIAVDPLPGQRPTA